jgi:thioredoxin-related protein
MTADPMRKYSLLASLWLAAVALVALPVRAATADTFFDHSLGDFAAELKIAQQQGKQGILLVFEAESCPYCRRMREQVLSQTPVQQFYQRHFNIFSVDFSGSVSVVDFAGKDLTEKAFARTQRVRGTPTFLFVGIDGREMARYTGATRDVGEFMILGRYITEGHSKTMTFEQYYPATRAASKTGP